MTEDIQPEVLRRTQETLGKFIKKPVLTEKLLRKPPFRFLHDICTAAMKETGFLEDTLSGNDAKIELITDKEGKIAFLQKVIAAVEAANNVKLTVRPNKIVAGHEPVKTNEFLQALANALEKQVQEKGIRKVVKAKPAVKKEEEVVKRKNIANKPSNKTSEQPPPEAKKDDKKRKVVEKKEKIDDSKKPDEERKKKRSKNVEKNEAKLKKEEPVVNGFDSPRLEPEPVAEEEARPITARPVSAKHKKRTPSAHPALTASEEVGAPSEAVDRVLGGVVNDLPSSATSRNSTHSPAPNGIDSGFGGEESTRVVSPEQPSPAPLLASATPKPSQAVSPQIPSGDVPPSAMSRPRTAIRPPSARPASARPAAPRVRDRGIIPPPEEIIQPIGKVNLIVEQDIQQDDEELVSVQMVQEDNNTVVGLTDNLDNAEHGLLVNQILEVQKELEDDTFAKKSSHTEIEWSTGRGVEATRREMEKIKAAVQSLTRSANPLGKLLEYLQDDVDSMQQELMQWRERNDALAKKLEQETNLTDKSIEPLKSYLEELEASILVEVEQIGALKANILKNDEKINRLLTGL